MKLNKFVPPGARRTRTSSSLAMLLLAFLMLFSIESQASHYRYGNISYTWNSGKTVTFHISQAYRRSYPWPTTPNVGTVLNVGTLLFGENNTSAAINLTVTSVNAAEDWFYGEATIVKTYVNNGTFTASFSSNARLSTLQNNADQPFRSECKVTIGNNNTSPASTMPPIVNVQTNQNPATFQLAANDPDGNTMTYRLATTAEMGGGTNTNPVGLSINSSTGVVSFVTTGKAVNNLYNAAFVVTDALGATTMTDVMIKIVQQSTPPIYDYVVTPANNTTYDIQPGQNVSFQVKVSDIDPGDAIASLNAVGLPTGSTVTPSLPAAGNPVTVTFSWTPTNAQLGSRIVSFVAQDNNGNQTTTNVNIIVSMNPIFDVPPTPENNAELCVATGVAYTATIQAHAPDPLVTLQIASATALAGVTYTPSVPTTFANSKSITMNWTPTAAQWGPHTFNYTATDNIGHSKTHSFELVANSAPVFTSAIAATTTITVNQPFTYYITASDADVPYGDDLDIEGTTIPTWMTLTPTGPGTATLTGTPGPGDVGTHHLQIDAEDIYHHCQAPVSQFFDIEVQPCTYTTNITPSVNGTQCPGTSVTLTADLADSYVWSNGETTQSITVVANGTATYTVTGTSGYCSASATATVSGIDNTAPVPDVATLPTITGECSYTATAPTATDACTGPVTATTNDVTSFTGNGSWTIHWTYTDGNGNSSSQDQTVTLQDVTNPVISGMPADIVTGNDAGNCNAVVSWNAPGASDNCGAVTLTSNHQPGETFPVGATTVTYTATDATGLQSTASFTITVNDDEYPTISAPAAVTVTADAGLCSASGVALGTPTTNDNCGVQGTATNDAPATFTVGNTAVTWTVTDIHGHSATATQMVTVTDDENPTISAPAAVSVSTDAGLCSASNVALGTPTTGDNCGVQGSATNDAPATFPEGSTTVTWTVTDIHGHTATATQMVTVTDNEFPSISAPAAVTVNADAGLCSASGVNLGNATVGDNCGIQGTATNNGLATYPVGTTTVTWSVTDIHGHTSTATQLVTVVDNQNPSITAPANVVINGWCTNTTANLGTPTTSDNCGLQGPATNNAPATFPVGTTTVTWSVTDVNGNTSTATQTVTVNPLTLSLSATVTNVSCNGGNNGAIDLSVNNGTSPYSYSWTGGVTTQDRTGLAQGTYTVGVTDAHSCTGTASYTVTQPTLLTGSFNTEPARITPECPGGYILWGYDTDISVTMSGGTTPYSYNWTAGATGSTATGTFGTTGNPPAAFTVVVTDANGCTKTLTKTTCITDVRCGNNVNMDHKVTICHRAGNRWNTICVDENAVPSHLAHGDMVGACNLARHGNLAAETEFMVFPNPSNGSFTVTLVEEAAAKVVVTDIQGRVVFTQAYAEGEATIKVDMPTVSTGIYFLNVENGTSSFKTKISVQ